MTHFPGTKADPRLSSIPASLYNKEKAYKIKKPVQNITMESKLMELHDKYHHIGEGWCGVVFQHPDRPFAVKIYKTPSTSPDFNHATFEPGCLGQDFNQHRKLVKAWDPSIQARMDGLPILPRLDSFISPRHNVRWPEDRKTSLGLDWQAFETSRLDDR